MDDITWQEPPPTHADRARAEEFRKALRERPGDWAVYGSYGSYQQAGNLRRSRLWSGFEITARKRDDGSFDIYARYVGGDAS